MLQTVYHAFVFPNCPRRKPAGNQDGLIGNQNLRFKSDAAWNYNPKMAVHLYTVRWKKTEDVSPEILQIVDRHMKESSPFDVYAMSLQRLFPVIKKWTEGVKKLRDNFYRILKP